MGCVLVVLELMHMVVKSWGRHHDSNAVSEHIQELILKYKR